MKKKLCLLMALVCCVAVFAVAFAACNNGDGKSGGNGGGAGDVIFTEDASLEDIIAALENAESMTLTIVTQEVGTHNGDPFQYDVFTQYTFMRDAYTVAQTVESDEPAEAKFYFYRSDGLDYSVYTAEDTYKDLALYEPDMYSEVMYNLGAGLILSYVTTDANGNMIVTGDGADIIEGTAYIKLNGSSMEIYWEQRYVDEDYDIKQIYKYTYSGVNATTVEIPDEVRALEAEAEWTDRVSYNGILYEKAEDENGEEYYYVSYVYDESADPEETINTLPVRERR